LKYGVLSLLAMLLALTACAQSSIQPMSQDTFKVATTAAPACGPNGARNVAFKTAAVEVIRRGADKFVLVGDTNNSNVWSGAHDQSMIVRIIPEGSREAGNALSARGQLGADWQTVVASGAPTTCT
jgi:major membrane immunogen (membrane-anchored lipoprotein)